jgi:hypothetical protein
MWGSTVLDLGIGLIFLYLLLALICSVMQELIANVTSWRGRHLRASIKVMLDDPSMTGLAKRIYANPRVRGLSLPGKLPSYIPPETFSRALIDILAEQGSISANTDSIRGPLAPFIRDAAGDADRLRSDLEVWFDNAMDRYGGWYKRNVQLVLLAMGMLLAIGLNANTLEAAHQLWTQPVLRAAIVDQARGFSTEATTAEGAAPANAGPPNDIGTLLAKVDSALPVGWTNSQVHRLFGNPAASGQVQHDLLFAWLTAIAGWTLTALATSLGAQFWFDTLGKALNIRAAGEKPV